MLTRRPGTAITAAILGAEDGGFRIHRVAVEVAPSTPPSMTLLGVPPDTASVTRDRIRAAVLNTGHTWPDTHITARITPDLRRGDEALDLPLALAVLAATGQLPPGRLADTVGVAGLGLDGHLRPVGHASQRLTAAGAAGYRRVLVAENQLLTVPGAPDLHVRAAQTLADLRANLRDRVPLLAAATWPTSPLLPGADFADLPDRPTARLRRITEIAAAGGHHVLTVGQHTGALLAAERLPRLLPDLDPVTAGQVDHLRDQAGHVSAPGSRSRPPWQAPALAPRAGASTGTLTRPGIVALAHGGVLFADRAELLPPGALAALRQALTQHAVAVQRGHHHVRWPARIQLWLHTAGCPHPVPGCGCSERARHHALRRLEPVGELLHLRQALPELPVWATDAPPGEATALIAARVGGARARAAARWTDLPHPVNAHVSDAMLRRSLPASRYRSLAARVDRGELSIRGLHAILRVAWTVADLAGQDQPRAADIDEATALHREGPAVTGPALRSGLAPLAHGPESDTAESQP